MITQSRILPTSFLTIVVISLFLISVPSVSLDALSLFLFIFALASTQWHDHPFLGQGQWQLELLLELNPVDWGVSRVDLHFHSLDHQVYYCLLCVSASVSVFGLAAMLENFQEVWKFSDFETKIKFLCL